MKEGGKVHPPPMLFTYVARSAPAVGAPVGSFTVNFGSGLRDVLPVGCLDARLVAIDLRCAGRDGERGTRRAHQRDRDEREVLRRRRRRRLLRPDGRFGPVEVFTDGRLQKGKWFRRNIHLKTAYRSESGKVIALRPGQTWVELLATGGPSASTHAPSPSRSAPRFVDFLHDDPPHASKHRRHPRQESRPGALDAARDGPHR